MSLCMTRDDHAKRHGGGTSERKYVIGSFRAQGPPALL